MYSSKSSTAFPGHILQQSDQIVWKNPLKTRNSSCDFNDFKPTCGVIALADLIMCKACSMVKESCSRGIGCHGLISKSFQGAVKSSTRSFKAKAMFLERHSGKLPSQHLNIEGQRTLVMRFFPPEAKAEGYVSIQLCGYVVCSA